eukprot:g32859.t1
MANLNKYATTVTDSITLGARAQSISAVHIRSAFLKVNTCKATGLDGVPNHALRSCADQLVGVFTDIFNLSLLQSKVPTCFKKTTINPMPKKNHAVYINDYLPVALKSIIMKCFESLVMAHVNCSFPDCFDSLQFAYWRNRSMADAISLALRSSLEHLDNRKTHVRLLLIDFSSTFNTKIPNKLISKLQDLRLSNWILNFLTNRLHLAKFHTNSIYKFADNTTVGDQISSNDEMGYRKEIGCLVAWCKDSNLTINVSKMKELDSDFRKQIGGHIHSE